MNTKKMLLFAAIAVTLLMLAPAPRAQAHGCYPLWLPFAAAGAALGTAAAIASAPFYPYYGYGPAYYAPPPPPAYYYQPAPRYWLPGHYTPYGAWIPGHWVYR
ncbi:MAG: hypothetical protein ACP5SH_25790 [Syntrophobacteraceae bacterium]